MAYISFGATKIKFCLCPDIRKIIWGLETKMEQFCDFWAKIFQNQSIFGLKSNILAFKGSEISKLLEVTLSFKYQNVQAPVKFWYRLKIKLWFLAEKISVYLITVFYDHPVEAEIWAKEKFKCKVFFSTHFMYLVVW